MGWNIIYLTLAMGVRGNRFWIRRNITSFFKIIFPVTTDMLQITYVWFVFHIYNGVEYLRRSVAKYNKKYLSAMHF